MPNIFAFCPQKVIFYMKNPDGNLDDLSQHAAMPVLEGEKWFLNLWSWDPIRD
jgi:prolyl 4-hydroxylase